MNSSIAVSPGAASAVTSGPATRSTADSPCHVRDTTEPSYSTIPVNIIVPSAVR